MRLISFCLAMLGTVSGYASGSESPAGLDSYEQEARALSQRFVKQLGGTLQQELQQHGPVAAISVCRDTAPKIATELSLQTGWRVTRVSDGPRNSLLGIADAWEQAELDNFRRRQAAGEVLKDQLASAITSESGRRYYRYLQPLVTGELCLACHGAEDQIDTAVRSALDERYPHDHARGYKLGDLRGALSIKRPLAANP
jgi:hypothetical protein